MLDFVKSLLQNNSQKVSESQKKAEYVKPSLTKRKVASGILGATPLPTSSAVFSTP